VQAVGTASPKPPEARAEIKNKANVTTMSEHLVTRIGVGAPTVMAETPMYAQRMLRDFLGELAREKDPLKMGRLHYEIARLYESPLGDLVNAADYYQRAYALCPDHLPTLRGARRALIAKKAFAQAVPLFDAEIRFTSDAAQRALLFYEKGRLHEDHLGQKREAREAYAAAAELDGTNPTILKALERADVAAKSWDAVDKTLQSTANAVGNDVRHRAAVLVERARLIESKRGDSRSATELYNEAFNFDPRATGAMEALKRLHYAHERWRDLANVLQKEAEQATDPVVRAMAYFRMGRVLVDRLGHVDEGIAAFERAQQETPQDPMILEELVRLFELQKKWDSLAPALERLVQRTRSDLERLGILHRIGQIYEERLADEARAIAWFSQALSSDPTYLPALQALGKIYTRRKDWQPLIAMHLNEAGSAQDASRRAAAHARIATIFEEQLGSSEQAAEHHSRALGLLPGYAPSFKALSRIFQAGQKYRELIELYERAVDQAKDASTKITFLFKIGRIHEDALDAPGNAMGAYRRVLDVKPDHFGAIHALQRAAERAERWKELVATLELEAEKVSDKKDAASLYHRAGEVLEDHLEDPDGALLRYKKVTDIDKMYGPALASLGRLYYKAGRWEDLLDTYKRELESTPKGPPAAALLYKMAELCEERIGRDDDALGYFKKAIEADPFHTPSLHGLERKLAERGQWQELVKLIELELSGLTDGEARARTAFHLGEVYEHRLNQPEKALAAYDQAVVAQEDFRPALDGRKRLLTQAKDWKRLVEDLAREAASAKDPLVAMSAQFQQAEIFRDELSDTKRAIESFEAVLSRDPSHLGALMGLEPLYVETSSWAELAGTYATEARVFADPGARVAALRELARLEEARGVGTPEELRAAYIAILQLAPSDAGALGALERMAIDGNDRQLLMHVDAKLGATLPMPQIAGSHQTRLAETLELLGDPSALETFRGALGRDADNLAAAHGVVRIAESSDNPPLLSEAAEVAFRTLGDKSAGAKLLVRASSAFQKANDFNRALSCLETALEKHPDSEDAALEIHRLLLSKGEVDQLLDVLCQAAQWATQPERMAALWLSVSELFADHKKDMPAAIASLHRVTEALPAHVATLMKLGELYARDQQWAESVDRLKRVLAAQPAPEVEVRAHLILARILKQELGDEERALQSIRRVLAIDARNREALERLLEIEMRRNMVGEAAQTAAQLVSVATNNNERADALCHLARLERQNKQLDSAAHAYEQAVTLMGMEGRAAAEFKDLLLEQKLVKGEARWDFYVGALTGYAEQVGDPQKRAHVMLELSRVLSDEMGQLDRGLQALQRALTGDPASAELRIELAGRMKAAGHFQQAIAEHRRLLEGDVTRAETWRDMIECWQKLGRNEEAAQGMSALVALGLGNDLERATLASRSSRTGSTYAGAFDEVAIRGISTRSGSDYTADLLRAVAESLNKVYPPELERWGVVSRDRITTRSGHPLKMLADRTAAAFGPMEFDLYLHRAHNGNLEIEFTDPPGIMVPAHVTSLRETEQVFLLARPLALLARGLQVVGRLAPAEVALLVVSAVRSVDPSYGAGMADEDFLIQQAKRVQKALSRRGRRALEEVAPLYMSSAQPDFEVWCQEVRRTSVRSAAILADDLPASITLLRRMEGDLAGLRGVALQQGMALMHDLLRFWVSDAAFAVRRRLGMM
jgi:tetratricopeptide (TPR) repeat protein